MLLFVTNKRDTLIEPEILSRDLLYYNSYTNEQKKDEWFFFPQFSHKTGSPRVVSFLLEPNFYRDRRELPFEFSKDIYIYKTTPLTHLPLMLSSRARTIFCSLHNIQLRVEIAGNFFPPFPLFLSFSPPFHTLSWSTWQFHVHIPSGSVLHP